MASDSKQWTEVAESPEVTDGAEVSEHEVPGSAAGTTLRRAVAQSWRVLEFSSAYLAAIAAIDVIIVMYLLSLSPSVAPVVVGLVTFAVYANDRLVDLETDAISNPDRTAFVHQHKEKLYVLAALSYGLAVMLAVLGGPIAFALTLVPGFAWVVYAVDWLHLPDVEVSRLKQLPVVSSVLIAVAWALTVVLLPVAFAGAALTPTVGVLFIYFALGAFLSAEVSNIYDMEDDIASGVTTLPTMLGIRRTQAVLSGVALVAAAVPAAAVAADYLSVRAALLLALGVVTVAVASAVLHRFDRGRIPTLAAEATHLPVPVAVALLALV
jgi:4-hydroxybenzoate polyprenyltransferase